MACVLVLSQANSSGSLGCIPIALYTISDVRAGCPVDNTTICAESWVEAKSSAAAKATAVWFWPV